ncbi:MAG: DUF2125 domain-containing protein [Alphaproteobacteria bacterium]|nr:DUF2125 domain-containing protein [Alphaproteobacteria bacterium]MCL2453473.1 DUF2125 domain-containing protein [Alphaproteobacteria bacterium]
MSSVTKAIKERASTYSHIFIPAAILLIIAVGWSIFWFFASRQAVSAVGHWLEQEAKLGRNWTCLDQKIGGYPFKIEIMCSGLQFSGNIADMAMTGSVPGFEATAPLLRQDDLLIRLEPPFIAKAQDGGIDLNLGWKDFYVQLEGSPGAYQSIVLAGTQVKLQGHVADLPPLEGGFNELQSHLSLAQDRHDNSYDFTFAFNDGAIPALTQVLHTQESLYVQFGGSLSQVPAGNATTFADFLEHWRTTNGHLDIASARLSSGGTQFEATGGLGLDEQHRVNGELNAVFAGFDKVFRQLHMDPGVLVAGKALSGLMGKGSGVPGRLDLPLSFSAGHVSIGPVLTPLEIPPLY